MYKKILFTYLILIIFTAIFTACNFNQANPTITPIPTNSPNNSISPTTESNPSDATFKITSGLLLGLRKDESDKVSTYRTLWIIPEDNKFTLKGSGNFILAPYENSFWKIENIRYNYDIQYLLPYSIQSKPPFKTFKTKEEIENGKSLLTNCNMKLLFVGNKYACYTIDRFDFMVGSKNGRFYKNINVNEIKDIDFGTSSLHIEDTLGSDAYSDAKMMKKTINGEYTDGWSEPQKQELNWGVTRGKGNFVLQVLKPRQYFEQGLDYIAGNLLTTLPKAFVTYDDLHPEWRVVQEHFPNAIDAISSPQNDVIGVIQPDRIKFFSLNEDKIGSQVLDIETSGETVVMAQWSIKNNINSWQPQIIKAFNTSNPTPTQVPANAEALSENDFIAGQIKLYMPYDDVFEKMKDAPDKVTNIRIDNKPAEKHSFYNGNIEVSFVNKAVYQIIVNSSDYSSHRGLKIGDTYEKIKALYGNPSKIEAGVYTYEFRGYPVLYITVTNDKVSKMLFKTIIT